jgi:hypothetical protein
LTGRGIGRDRDRFVGGIFIGFPDLEDQVAEDAAGIGCFHLPCFGFGDGIYRERESHGPGILFAGCELAQDGVEKCPAGVSVFEVAAQTVTDGGEVVIALLFEGAEESIDDRQAVGHSWRCPT